MNEIKVKKRWAKRFLLLLLGLIVGALACEAVLRTVMFSPIIKRHPALPGANHPRYLFMPDPDAGYTLRPYFTGVDENFFGDFRAKVIINNMGFRDNRREAKVNMNRFRILMLGDSLTFGEGVSYENSYPALVERALISRHVNAQVINGAVPGYGLAQMFERLKTRFDAVTPHMVTAAWAPHLFHRETMPFQYMNGYLVESTKLDQARPVGDNIFYTKYRRGSLAEGVDLWLQSHSFVRFFIKYDRLWGLFTIEHATKFAQMRGRTRQPLTLPPIYLKKPMESVIRMADYCHQRNATFLLIIINPSLENARQITQYCGQRGIPVRCLVPSEYLGDLEPYEVVFDHDAHFNETGNRLIAENVASFIISLK
jgi:lysophospholipase L1-like esterase